MSYSRVDLLSAAIYAGLRDYSAAPRGCLSEIDPRKNPCTLRLSKATDLRLRCYAGRWELWAITPHDIFGTAAGIVSTLEVPEAEWR